MSSNVVHIQTALKQRNRPIDTPSNQSAFKKTTTQLLPLVVSAPAALPQRFHQPRCPVPQSRVSNSRCSCASSSDTKPNKPAEEQQLRNKGIRARQSVVDGWPAKVEAAAAETTQTRELVERAEKVTFRTDGIRRFAGRRHRIRQFPIPAGNGTW